MIAHLVKVKNGAKKSFSYVAKTIGSNMHSLGIKFFLHYKQRGTFLRDLLRTPLLRKEEKSPKISSRWTHDPRIVRQLLNRWAATAAYRRINSEICQIQSVKCFRSGSVSNKSKLESSPKLEKTVSTRDQNKIMLFLRSCNLKYWLIFFWIRFYYSAIRLV